MKLWQKIYLVTILLFVVALNVGIFLVFDMTYQKNLSAEQKRAESEYRMISASILRSMRNLEKQGRLKKAPLQGVLGIYEKYYVAQKIHLALWKDGKCIYPEESDSSLDRNVLGQEIQIRIRNQNGGRRVQVQGMLYENNGKYYLQYEKALSELDETWEQLQKKYILVSIGFSLGLEGILYLLLRRVMKPIQELMRTVDKMRSGNLSARVKVKGADDIAVLGGHFNEMAEKIQKDIFHIQKEMQAKQSFVDNFAHELKSPVTSIYGFAEYVQKANVPEQEITECMELHQYSLCINSVTGEVFGYVDYHDRGADAEYGKEFEAEELKKLEPEFRAFAENFVSESLNLKKAEAYMFMEGLMDTEHACREIFIVHCKTAENDIVAVTMDPIEKSVLCFEINPIF